ncbi:MAG: HEAT repeat domain-containing protein [Acidobacteriota bacterium]
MSAARSIPVLLVLSSCLPALASERAVWIPAKAGTVSTSCGDVNSAACTAALEALARKAADDLTLLANSGKPEHRPLARDAAKMPFASLRSSAASALGHLSPGPEDTPLLAGLLNDPVPGVRRAAKRALEFSSDPAARPLAERARLHESGGLRPQSVPTANQLKTPLYAGAQYLYYASDRPYGQSEFSTGDAVEKVAAFYAGKFGAAMTLEQFRAAEKSGENAMPDVGSQAFQDQMQAAIDAQKAYEAALKAGKSQQDASMAMVAAMQAKAPADSSRIRSALEKKDIYGSPRLFVVEKGMMPGAPNRLVAVYKDLLLGKTGIAVFTAPLPEE